MFSNSAQQRSHLRAYLPLEMVLHNQSIFINLCFMWGFVLCDLFSFLSVELGKWNCSCSNFGGRGQKAPGRSTRSDAVLAARSPWGCWWTEAPCAMGAATACAPSAASAWTPASGNAPFVMLMGKEFGWFAPVTRGMPTGFVHLLLEQLMKQSHWCNENVGWSPGSDDMEGNFVLFFT